MHGQQDQQRDEQPRPEEPVPAPVAAATPKAMWAMPPVPPGLIIGGGVTRLLIGRGWAAYRFRLGRVRAPLAGDRLVRVEGPRLAPVLWRSLATGRPIAA